MEKDFNCSFSHEELISMIEQYDGDIDKVKDLLEKKDFNLLNLVNGIQKLN